MIGKTRGRKWRGAGRSIALRATAQVEAVFSTEPLTRARDQQSGGLACAGYGSGMVMTASVGLFMVGRALEALLAPSA